MSDDLLSQYTNALKQEYDGSTVAPEATRARVIRTLAERRPRRAKWWTIGVPALVLLGGSTAWAGASGQLSVLVHQAGVALGMVNAAPPEPRQATVLKQNAGHGSPQTPTEETRPGSVTTTLEPEPSPSESERQASPVAASNRLVKSGLQTEGDLDQRATEDPALAQARAIESAALASYKRGHDAQFSSGNCGQAVAAYSSYLTQYPSGSFVLEARYNRAVCLVQLGHLAEARAALLPFAQGQAGGYRQSQAQALLDALSASTGDTQDN